MEASKDLGMACRLDYDDQANEWLKEVTPKVKKKKKPVAVRTRELSSGLDKNMGLDRGFIHGPSRFRIKAARPLPYN